MIPAVPLHIDPLHFEIECSSCHIMFKIYKPDLLETPFKVCTCQHCGFAVGIGLTDRARQSTIQELARALTLPTDGNA